MITNLKNSSKNLCVYAGSVICFVAALSSAHAALITNPESFDLTAAGGVPSGWQRDFGTQSQGGQTTVGVGIGGSNGFVGTDLLLGTINTYDLTQGLTYDFNVAFKFTGSGANVNAGFLGVGFTDIAGVAPFNAGGADRFMVGLAITPTAGQYTFAVGGQFNQMSTTLSNQFGGTYSLTTNNWYSFEGSVTYTDATSTFTYTNIILNDIGASGLGEPTLVSSVASFSKAVFATNGNTLDDAAARFTIASNAGRGVNTIDNINVIPEPSVYAALAGLLLVAVVYAHRRKE